MPEPIALSVSSSSYSTETVTFYNALESSSFRPSSYINYAVGSEKFCSEYISLLALAFFKTCEFNDLSLWSCIGLLEMAQFGFSSVFFFFVVKSKLYGIIAILVHCFNLCYNTWPGLQNRTWNILSVFIENGGHSYLFTN